MHDKNESGGADEVLRESSCIIISLLRRLSAWSRLPDQRQKSSKELDLNSNEGTCKMLSNGNTHKGKQRQMFFVRKTFRHVEFQVLSKLFH